MALKPKLPEDLPKVHQFDSGALSSELKPRFDLVPFEAVEAIAIRFAKGLEVHGKDNWKKGIHDEAFVVDRQNHALEHFLKYINDDKSYYKEDSKIQHLQAAICNLAMLCYIEKYSSKMS